jgi:gliding motility-associated-like protein
MCLMRVAFLFFISFFVLLPFSKAQRYCFGSEGVPSDVILTKDTTICIGDSFQIRTTGSGVDFCWQPVTGLVSSSANPIAKPAVTTTFTFTSQTVGPNTVINGDFSNGNVGFNSEYLYSSSGIPPSVYTVGTNPILWHPQMTPCADHTSGNGNMMMVNGSEQLNTKVWTQTIAVTPNTMYVFSTWLETITTVNPAELQFSINGIPLANPFTADARSCVWKQFYTTWNSGSNTTAVISIINMNQGFSGNDFAIDDIFFGEISLKTESIVVTIASLPKLNLGKDTTLCKGSTLQLTSNTDVSDISWSPSTYLSNSVIANPVASPLQNISYIASAKTTEGCYRKDTIAITVIDQPTVKLPEDVTVCKGTAVTLNAATTFGTKYNWEPTAGLSNYNSPNTVATPTATGRFKLTVINQICSAADSILITVNELPVIDVSRDTTICASGQAYLQSAGAVSYKWTPTTGLSDSNISGPVSSPLTSTVYSVYGTDANGCTNTKTVKVSVNPKPVFGITPATQIICVNDSAIVKASGGDVYRWIAAAVLTSESSNQLKVFPLVTTKYKVLISNSTCKMQDSLTAVVNVRPLPVISVTKSNDINCSNMTTGLTATGASTYEWSPRNTLSSPAVHNPVASPSSTTTYYVTGKSSDGCTSKDSIEVKVVNAGTANLNIPSAFTPNGDGRNDCFRIKALGSVSWFVLKIYNRWGENVFSTSNTMDCWDGTFKGVKQDAGTFVYYMKAKTICGDVFRKGTIILIR